MRKVHTQTNLWSRRYRALACLAIATCAFEGFAGGWDLTKRILSVPQDLASTDDSTLVEVFSEAFVIQFDDEGELVDLPSWVKKSRYNFDAENGNITKTYPSLRAASTLSQFEVARNAITSVRESEYTLNLIFFVHGWKHNSKRESHPKNVSNLESFEKLLRVLNERSLARAKTNDPRALYMGVYIGWRGSPWPTLRNYPTYHPIRLLNWLPLNLTFWNRLRAADRISRASLSYVLLSLNAEAKQLKYPSSDDSETSLNHTVIIGHSMGARIVEQTLSQVIIGEIANGALELRLAEEEVHFLQEQQDTIELQSASNAVIEQAIEVYEDTLTHWVQLPQKIASEQDLSPSWENFIRDAEKLSDTQSNSARILLANKEYFSQISLDTRTDIIDTLKETEAELKALLIAARTFDTKNFGNDSVFQRQQIAMGARTFATANLLFWKTLKLHESTQRTPKIDPENTLEILRRQNIQQRIDLVFLINPANGSILSRQLTEAFADPHLSAALNHRKVDGKNIPWIIAVSSPSDLATGKTYGITSAVQWSLRKYRKDENRDQFRYFKKPAPHNISFRNLELRKAVDSESLSIPNDLQDLISLNFDEDVLSNWLHTNGESGLHNVIVTADGAYQLRTMENVQSHPSYWAVFCYDGIIDAHHDIFKEKTIALIAGFMRLSKSFNSSDEDTPTPSVETDDILDELQ